MHRKSKRFADYIYININDEVGIAEVIAEKFS